MDMLQFLLTNIGGPTLICTVILTLVNRHLAKKDKREDRNDETQAKLKVVEDKIKTLETKHANLEYMEPVVEGLAVKVSELEYKVEENKRILGAVDEIMLVINNSLKALLRDRIIDKYNHHMEKQYIPIYERESLDSMLVEYKNLGGGEVLNKLVEKLHALPTKEC